MTTDQAAYPTGPVKRGGVTDRWLGDYANLFGDTSAVSGNNALARDPEFTRRVLAAHEATMQARLDETARIVAELQSGVAPVTHTPVHVRYDEAVEASLSRLRRRGPVYLVLDFVTTL